MAGQLGDSLEANLVCILLERCIRLNIAFASLPHLEWILAKEEGSHGLLKENWFGSFLCLQPRLVFQNVSILTHKGNMYLKVRQT